MDNMNIFICVCTQRNAHGSDFSLENRPPAAEIILVHDGSYTDPYDLDDEIRFIVDCNSRTCCELLNAGLQACKTEIAHIVMAGTIVRENWTNGMVERFGNPRIATVSPLITDLTKPESVVSQGVRLSWGGTRHLSGAGKVLSERLLQRVQVAGPSLLAGFYRVDTVLDVGGFATDVGDELADVDLAMTLSSLGYRCEFARECRIAAPAVSVPAMGFHGGRYHERLFWRHVQSRGKLRSLLSHPFTILSRALGDLPHPGSVWQLLGRLCALTDRASYREYRLMLDQRRKPSTIPLPAPLATDASSHSTAPRTARRAA